MSSSKFITITITITITIAIYNNYNLLQLTNVMRQMSSSKFITITITITIAIYNNYTYNLLQLTWSMKLLTNQIKPISEIFSILNRKEQNLLRNDSKTRRINLQRFYTVSKDSFIRSSYRCNSAK